MPCNGHNYDFVLVILNQSGLSSYILGVKLSLIGFIFDFDGVLTYSLRVQRVGLIHFLGVVSYEAGERVFVLLCCILLKLKNSLCVLLFTGEGASCDTGVMAQGERMGSGGGTGIISGSSSQSSISLLMRSALAGAVQWSYVRDFHSARVKSKDRLWFSCDSFPAYSSCRPARQRLASSTAGSVMVNDAGMCSVRALWGLGRMRNKFLRFMNALYNKLLRNH